MSYEYRVSGRIDSLPWGTRPVARVKERKKEVDKKRLLKNEGEKMKGRKEEERKEELACTNKIYTRIHMYMWYGVY